MWIICFTNYFHFYKQGVWVIKVYFRYPMPEVPFAKNYSVVVSDSKYVFMSASPFWGLKCPSQMGKHLVLPKPAVKRILNANMKFNEWASFGLDNKISRLAKWHSPCAQKSWNLYREVAVKMNHLVIVNTCWWTTTICCSKCKKNMVS